MCPLCFEHPSHLPSHSSSLCCHRARFEFPESYGTFPLAVSFTHGSVCASTLLSAFVPPSFPASPCPQACPLCLHLYPCPVNRFISTIFLDSMLLLLLSRFSRVRLCATPEMAAHQAPPSLGFSRQEHWSGLPFPSPMHESEKWKWSRSVVSDS